MNASELSRNFISSVLSSCNSYESANIMIENACGIVGFFGSDSELGSVFHSSDGYDRTEYGDYQTATIWLNVWSPLCLKAVLSRALCSSLLAAGEIS